MPRQASNNQRICRARKSADAPSVNTEFLLAPPHPPSLGLPHRLLEFDKNSTAMNFDYHILTSRLLYFFYGRVQRCELHPPIPVYYFFFYLHMSVVMSILLLI